MAVTKRILAVQDGPAILVRYSYGGAVITEAGNDPKVAGLVYITAFAPDKGDSVATLIEDPTRNCWAISSKNVATSFAPRFPSDAWSDRRTWPRSRYTL